MKIRNLTARFLCLSMCAMLFLLPLPVMAEGGTEMDIPFFILRQDGVDVGPAVLFYDESLLLTTSVIPNPDAPLTAFDPVQGTETSCEVSIEQGHIRVLSLEAPSAREPMQLADTLFQKRTYFATISSSGAIQSGDIERAVYLDPNANSVMITLHEPALPLIYPGTVVYDADGALCALLTARMAEGNDTAIGVSSYYLNEVLFGASNPQVLSTCTSTLDGCLLHLDWAGSAQAEASEGGYDQFAVFYADTQNSFYTKSTLEPDDTDFDLYLVPGRTYQFWICPEYSLTPITSMPINDATLTITIPLDEPFHRYSYENAELYLSLLSREEIVQGAYGDMDLLPRVDSMRVSDLQSPENHLYLQAENRYVVDEEIYDSLVVTLTAPDGECYLSVSSFLYSPDFMEKDRWHMDLYELVDSCISMHQGTLPGGEYTVAYYLGNAPAGAVTFTLEDE